MAFARTVRFVFRVLTHGDGDADDVVIVGLGESRGSYEPERFVGPLNDESEVLQRCDHSAYGGVPVCESKARVWMLRILSCASVGARRSFGVSAVWNSHRAGGFRL